MDGRGRAMTTKGEKRLAYMVLALPAVIIYLAVVAFPTIFSVLLSLTDYNGGPIFGPGSNIQFAGLKSYLWMFTDPSGNFYTALRNNLLIVGVSVFGQIPLGFILAYILSRKLIKKGNSFFQTMIYLPNVISSIIIGVLFRNGIYWSFAHPIVSLPLLLLMVLLSSMIVIFFIRKIPGGKYISG